jgi:hypothetical protein
MRTTSRIIGPPHVDEMVLPRATLCCLGPILQVFLQAAASHRDRRVRTGHPPDLVAPSSAHHEGGLSPQRSRQVPTTASGVRAANTRPAALRASATWPSCWRLPVRSRAGARGLPLLASLAERRRPLRAGWAAAELGPPGPAGRESLFDRPPVGSRRGAGPPMTAARPRSGRLLEAGLLSASAPPPDCSPRPFRAQGSLGFCLSPTRQPGPRRRRLGRSAGLLLGLRLAAAATPRQRAADCASPTSAEQRRSQHHRRFQVKRIMEET